MEIKASALKKRVYRILESFYGLPESKKLSRYSNAVLHETRRTLGIKLHNGEGQFVLALAAFIVKLKQIDKGDEDNGEGLTKVIELLEQSDRIREKVEAIKKEKVKEEVKCPE